MKRVDKQQQIEELLKESSDAVAPLHQVLLDGQIVTPFGPSIWVGKVSPELVDATLQCVEDVKDDKDNDLTGYLAEESTNKRISKIFFHNNLKMNS